ncbi:MAG: c-type cytochrome [Candidatus Solibacter usitatus]|nr:c-type cytochrome [Candidatus Solibacter usitatus]
MKFCAVLLFSVLAFAQDDSIATGAMLFRTHCSVAYCHGSAGTPGRAPQLAGRSFTREHLTDVIANGIPKTAMPGFKKELNQARIAAIASYVLSLTGPAAAEPIKLERRDLPPELKAGRALFFDATRMGGCGACHAADGWGIAIGPALAKNLPADAAALRAYQSEHVRRAELQKEAPLPALPVNVGATIVTVYDLSSPLPVLRTFAASEIRLTPNGGWNHAGTLRAFSDAELNSILSFLRALQ